MESYSYNQIGYITGHLLGSIINYGTGMSESRIDLKDYVSLEPETMNQVQNAAPVIKNEVLNLMK